MKKYIFFTFLLFIITLFNPQVFASASSSSSSTDLGQAGGSLPILSPTSRPLKIAITMFYDKGYKHIGDIAAGLNQRYADPWNYALITEHEPMLPHPEWSLLWEKVPLCIKHIESKKFDYVVFIDADAMVINHNQRIENLLPEDPLSPLFMVGAREDMGPNAFNSGVLIFKSCPESLNFLNQTLQYAIQKRPNLKQDRYHEQDCMSAIITEQGLEKKGQVQLLTAAELNCPSLQTVKFIYHAYGTSSNEKSVRLSYVLHQWSKGHIPFDPVSLSTIQWYFEPEKGKAVQGYLKVKDTNSYLTVAHSEIALGTPEQKLPIWFTEDIRSFDPQVVYMGILNYGIVCGLYNDSFSWTPNISTTGRLKLLTADVDRKPLTWRDFSTGVSSFTLENEKFSKFVGSNYRSLSLTKTSPTIFQLERC